MKKIIQLFILTFILLSANTVFAGSIKLKWNPSPEPDIGGYKLYYIEQGELTATEQTVDVGNVTTYELTGLTTGSYYLIEATAYDTSNNESERSYGVRGKAKYSQVVGLEIIL